MLYDSQIKKNLKILEQENQNTIDQKSISIPVPILTPENLTKPLVTINLIVGYDFQHGTFDPSANNNKGGYINPIVNIIQGGPNQIVPTI